MSKDIFIARQPIFDRTTTVFGYELLHRSHGQASAYTHTDGNEASSAVMNATLNVLNLEELIGDKRMFVNMTRDLLLGEYYWALPVQRTVLELLETVEPDAEVLAVCRKLKDAGYQLALDDFVFSRKYWPLLEMADILKIDFLASSSQEREQFPRRFEGTGVHLLAEKVESTGDMQEALNLGYTYFQGHFYCKPEIVSGRRLRGLKVCYLRLLAEIHKPRIDYDAVERIIKNEVALATKLLRYLNSAAFCMATRITSIRQALVLLGERPLRKWASLVALASLSSDKPAELAVTSLVRAHFCERLAGELQMVERELDLFLLGLFSLMDAMLDRPLAQALTGIPVASDVITTLGGEEQTRLGRVYALVLALEHGHWNLVSSAAGDLQLDEPQVAQACRMAVLWADQVFQELGSSPAVARA